MNRFLRHFGFFPLMLAGVMMGCGAVQAEDDLLDDEISVLEKLKAMDWEVLQQVEVRLDDVFDVFGGLIHKRKVSVATGEAQSMSKAPSVTTVITAQDIEAMGASSLSEVLRAVPGIHVSYNFIDNPIYTVRGISSINNPEILVLTNGIRLNNSQEGSTGTIWTSMPLNSVARIEVIRGPGSAVYGADAFSGVINIITKNSGDIAGTEAGGRVGNYDTRDAWVLHGGYYKGFDIATTFEYHSTDGFDEVIDSDAQTLLDDAYQTDVSHAPGPYNARVRTYDLKVDVLRNNWQLRAGYHAGRDKGTGAGAGEALDPSGYLEDERLNADLTYHNSHLMKYWDVTAQASLLRSYFKSSLIIYPPGTFGGAFPDGMIAIPSGREQHSRFDLSAFYSGFDTHLLRLGTGYVYDDFYETQEKVNFAGPLIDRSDTQDVFSPEVARESWYAFIQDLWKISPAWELTAGIRYDDYSDFGSTLNPRGAFVWQPIEKFTTKLLYGKAFRAPAFNELFIVNNPIQQGNPGLAPEINQTWELAFDYFATENLYLGINLFIYEIEDKIVYVPNLEAGTVRAENAGQWEGQGMEFELRWKPTVRSSILFNYAYQNTKDNVTDKELGNGPAHTAYMRADFLLASTWFLDTQFNWAADWVHPPGDPRGEVGDYTTVDLTLRRKGRDDAWNMAFGIRNVFDEDIRFPSLSPSGDSSPNIPGDYPSAGRHYFTELRYRF